MCAVARTVARVPEQELLPQLLTTPFVASWVGRARPADLFDPDPGRRGSAWADWALRAFISMTGHSDRPYVALTLPARFYDPRGTGMQVRPHLEVPARYFYRAAPDFPDRLAQAGNALLFPWWIVPELLAVKRALLLNPPGSVAEIADALNSRRPALVAALEPALARLSARWAVVEEMHVADPARLASIATGPFTAAQVAGYAPGLADFKLSIEFDQKLLTTSSVTAGRRVGVWRVTGQHEGEAFSFGVITPRLTRSSMFSDPLFAPAKESAAAALVRGLLARRLLAHLDGSHVSGAAVLEPAPTPPPAPAAPAPGLRAVVAHVGEKLPEASVKSAVNFVQTFPHAPDAWAALVRWAATPIGGVARATLTVTEPGFRAAHASASRAIRRAEEPERDDINVVLPLAWDHSARVVRVTFSRPAQTPS